jgi:hypothetical protein
MARHVPVINPALLKNPFLGMVGTSALAWEMFSISSWFSTPESVKENGGN